ncbi:MAG: hypothetical protein OEQ53_21975 [Saprospiraceae bacterium]|nr:hypothetical protein [Saprospiraceae bacterium]
MTTKFESNQLVNILLLLALVALAIFTGFQIVALWPPELGVPGRRHFLGYDNLNYEQILLILVTLGGALGAFIHVASSMSVRIANRNFSYAWLPWYILRPFVGGALAIAFYLLVRGGLVVPNPIINASPQAKSDQLLAYAASLIDAGDTTAALIVMESYNKIFLNDGGEEGNRAQAPPINLFGVMAIAVLAGLFSKQAVEKLQELFETMFRTEAAGDKEDTAE